MAKNPPDRPPTAGDFGRAALALRDGLEGTRPMPAMGMPPTARLAGTRPAGTAVLPRTGPPPAARRPEPAPARPVARRRNLRAPLIGLILLALLIGAASLLVRNLTGGTSVPDVKGLQLTRATQTSPGPGSQVKVNGGSSGVVQSQDPAAGHKAKKNSDGHADLRQPAGAAGHDDASTRRDYVGRRLGDVRSELAGLGFGVSLSGSTSPDAIVTSISPTGAVTNGSVISVTSRLQQTASPPPTADDQRPVHADADLVAAESSHALVVGSSSSAGRNGNGSSGNGSAAAGSPGHRHPARQRRG